MSNDEFPTKRYQKWLCKIPKSAALLQSLHLLLQGTDPEICRCGQRKKSGGSLTTQKNEKSGEFANKCAKLPNNTCELTTV